MADDDFGTTNIRNPGAVERDLDTIHIVKPSDRRPRWQRRPPGTYHDIPSTIIKTPKRRTVADYANIMGIPPGELTAAVQEALNRMSEELAHEHSELDLAQEHVNWLEQTVDSHSYLPIMNRRAFVRQIEHALAHVKRTGTSSALVLLHLRNAETVRRRFGRRALDSLQYLVAETLLGDSRDTDAVGGLGGSDFGVILALAEEDGATAKTTEIKTRLEELTPKWQGQPFSVEVGTGVRIITQEQTVEEILDAADKDLISQESDEIERETRTPWERE